MIYIFIFLILLTILLSFFCYNLYNQVVKLEKLYKKQTKKEVDIDNFYKYILGLLTHAYSEMGRIDQRGSFSSDDEVGFAFRIIYRAIEDTKTKLESIRVVDN